MKMEFEMATAFNGGDNAFGFPLIAAADEESCIVDGMADKLSFRALLSLCLNHEEQRPLLHLLLASSNFNCLPYEAVHPPMSLPENVALLESFGAFPAALIRSTQFGSYGGGAISAEPSNSLDGVIREYEFGHLPDLRSLEEKQPPNNFLADVIRGYGFGHLPDLRSLEKQPSNFPADVIREYGFGHLPDLRSLEKQPSNFLADVIREYGFGHLPDLRSLEKQPVNLNPEFGFRPPRNIGGASHEKMTGNYQPPQRQTRKAPKTESRSTKLARVRRQKQGEKTRLLQKMMPWETKMDMARMYEEAYKYVKFLQAQISVLQNMPARGALPSPNTISAALHGPLLARLSRQQLLGVMVNSPAIQTLLYSKGCCVFSVEQLAEIGKVVDRKFLFEQMLIASASISRA